MDSVWPSTAEVTGSRIPPPCSSVKANVTRSMFAHSVQEKCTDPENIAVLTDWVCGETHVQEACVEQCGTNLTCEDLESAILGAACTGDGVECDCPDSEELPVNGPAVEGPIFEGPVAE